MESSGGRKEVKCLLSFRFLDFIFVLPAANAAGFIITSKKRKMINKIFAINVNKKRSLLRLLRYVFYLIRDVVDDKVVFR